MVVLPYGSLSGTCATSSKNEGIAQEEQKEETVDIDRQI